MAEATLTFPPDFLWGTATAAHQVEGGNTNNDWWQWEQGGGGRIYEDQVSGEACGWWKPGGAEADIQRMKALNTNAHRLSIEWSRIEPEPGRWDHAALDRYREILKAMQKAHIQPMITLHHFTNPIWLAEQGEDGQTGWLHPGVVGLFRRFVEKAVSDLSDLCETWCTINEPTIFGSHGYFLGKWPPGHTSLREYLTVVRHQLQAHAAAYTVIHDLQPGAKVGLAHHMVDWHPRHPHSPLDRAVVRLLDQAMNRLVLDTLKTGWWQPPVGSKVELADVRNTLDWIGLNYYVRYDAGFSLRALKSLGIAYDARPGAVRGPGGWGEFYPDGLFACLRRLHQHFGLPIHITESGLPDLNDSLRPAFLARYLQRVWKAIQFNWPIMSYYVWSLVDNFEWAEGYDPRFRFGLYTVDWETGERTLTTSGQLYAEVAGTGTLTSDMVRRYAPDAFDDLFPGQGPADMHRLVASSAPG